MKCKTISLLMTLLFSLSAYGQAQSQELTWDFVKVTRDIYGNEQSDTITYSVNSEISKIESANEIIYIDYAKYALYRYNKLDRSCVGFPLNSNKTNEPVNTKENLRKRSIALVSSLKLLTTTEHKEIAHYNCSLKHIMFGADLALFQMVAPLVVTEFNQKFTESMVSYCVSDEVVGFSTLLNIAQKRSDVFKNNPLLRQFDIVGLLEILEGFPVQITHKFQETTSVTTLLNKPSLTNDKKLFLLPDECRE